MSLPVDLLNFCLGAAALGASLILVPVARQFGLRYGLVDSVHPAKIHAEPKVRCGGIGIYLAFVFMLAGGLLALRIPAVVELIPVHLRQHLTNIPSVTGKLAAIMLGATIMFLTGLVDDKRNLRPIIKLAFQVVAALPLIAAGITIKSFLPGFALSALLTVFWVILLTNSFNFLDNMNGSSSGIVCVCALNFYLVSRAGGEYFMMAMFALLIGATLGFLRYNFPNARLFMGDSGSLFLGFMLAALSIRVTYYQSGVPTQLPVIAPLIILGVPLFDTASVMYIRWRNRKPFTQGDQNHFSHRLVALGFSRAKAVMFIWLITFTVGLSAVNLRTLNLQGALIALLQVILFFLIIYFLETTGKRAMNEKENVSNGN
ncbi:MAG: MraY family glycosyltransferase [Candidatus Sumerlaeaceae bacterium]